MRSRYTAYVMKEIDYLRSSLHPDHRSDFNQETTRAWAERSEWHKLEILDTVGGGPDDTEGTVDFIATFTDNGTRHEHHELSSFRKESGTWYLVDGKVLPPKQVVRTEPKIGRNDPCPCGSSRKFKKCCGSTP
jgi:SEC-C motif-containing protein